MICQTIGPVGPLGVSTYCTLERGHDGPHAAWAEGEQVACWSGDFGAAPLPEPMSVSEREQAAEAIGLLAEWVHRVASGLAGARVLGSDQLGYALSAMNAATATLARMGECQPGDDGAVVFARLKERSMRKAQILAGQGIPTFGKRGRG